jgi:uncharacterized membrane protein
MAVQSSVSPTKLSWIKNIDRVALFVARHWLLLFALIYGAWVLVPFAAPLLMREGANDAANAVYFFYSFFCHQLPERSLFFFGPQWMYSYQQIGQVWPTTDATVLRQFIGNAQMGWKVAWSDRMISFYGGAWLAGLVYAVMGKRAPRVSLAVWLVIGILPVGIDGFSHFVNDIVAGTSGTGFRDTNAWLQVLTGNIFPASFYAGDALGSFNSWMRWLTGFLFSFTTVFALFPLFEQSMRDIARDLEFQLARVLLREREAQ